MFARERMYASRITELFWSSTSILVRSQFDQKFLACTCSAKIGRGSEDHGKDHVLFAQDLPLARKQILMKTRERGRGRERKREREWENERMRVVRSICFQWKRKNHSIPDVWKRKTAIRENGIPQRAWEFTVFLSFGIRLFRTFDRVPWWIEWITKV